MAKSGILIVAAALCLVCFVGSAHGVEKFHVEGKVYCDTCRIQFPTRVSQFLPGSKVRLECKEYAGDSVTFSKEATTDETGTYRMEVDGDHEDELCEVVLVESSRADCTEVDSESHIEQAAKISLTTRNGIVSTVREANPLGFLLKERLPVCSQIFDELGLRSDGLPLN